MDTREVCMVLHSTVRSVVESRGGDGGVWQQVQEVSSFLRIRIL